MALQYFKLCLNESFELKLCQLFILYLLATTSFIYIVENVKPVLSISLLIRYWIISILFILTKCLTFKTMSNKHCTSKHIKCSSIFMAVGVHLGFT